MTEEKVVHLSMRKEDITAPDPQSMEEDCRDCGKTVVVSSDNVDLQSLEENIDPEEVDVFVCQVCGMKRLQARGMAG